MSPRRNLGKGKQGITGAADLFISHRRDFTGHKKGFVMKNSSRLMSAVAPLALMGVSIVPSAPALATETATPRPIPKIRTPSKPVEVEKLPRIPAQLPDSEGSSVKVESAEASPDAPKRIRVAVPQAEAGDIKSIPRVRRKMPTPIEAEPSAAEPAAPRRVRVASPPVDTSTPAESTDTPRIRTRVPVAVEETATTEPDAPRKRTRIDATQIDTGTPAEIDNTPYSRRRMAVPVETPSTPATEEQSSGRKRGRAGSDTAAVDPEKTQRNPPKTARIDHDNGSQISRSFVGTIKPGAVILKPGSYDKILSNLPVTRTLNLNALAANPIVTLGNTKFDFSPMLNNPKSLQNVGKRLMAFPNLVEVLPATAAASQIKQGVIVRSELSYRMKSGACSSAANRSLLANAGISCFTYKSLPAREADFSNPNAIEFVENASDRSAALANARAQSQANEADIAQNVANFRVILSDPAQRAQVEETIGAAETSRLEMLDDAALAGELVNFHEATIEEVAFIPIWGVELPSNAWFEQWQKSKVEEQLKKLAAADAQLAVATKATSYPIGDFNFLAGFTLGSKHEWRQGVSTTIKWCVFGCKKTYFAEAWAGFHYGFGLRFPMHFSGTYNFDPAGKGSASLTSTLTMIDGNSADYRSTGLPEDKVFSGQELVAEFGVNAGIHANLPLIGGIGPFQFDPTIKLTDLLPAPFVGGNMTPPMPASSGMGGDPPEAKFVLDQVDLLGERANLGIVSAKIHPAIYIGVKSEGMSLIVSGTNPTDAFKAVPLLGGIETTTLPIGSGQISSFSVGAPKYNISFTLTPGLTARLSLNLAVWGTSVDWDVRFPAAQISVPSGGIDFACHEGTICTRSFTLGPDGQVSLFRRDLKAWGLDFDKYWLPKCLDEICTTSVKLKRYDFLEAAYAQEAALKDSWVSADLYKNPMQSELGGADVLAEKYVEDSKNRKVQKASDTSAAMSKIALAYYIPQCKDSLCADNIAALAAQMGPRAQQLMTAGISRDPETLNKMVNKEFSPKFVAEIDASKMRIEMKKAKSMQDQLGKMGGKQPTVPGKVPSTKCKNMRCGTN